MLTIIILFIFITVFLIQYSIISLFFLKPKTIDRINPFINPIKKNNITRKPYRSQGRRWVNQFSKLISLFGKGISQVNMMTGRKRKVQKELIKAGIPLKGEEFIVIQLFSGVLLALLLFEFTQMILVVLFSGIIGFIIPEMVVRYKKSIKTKRFNDQLGDTIVLISNSLKVGHSFLQAVDTASKEMPEPISKELGKFIHEMKLGITIEEGLKHLSDRVESDDLNLLITAVNIQRQTGGNLAEILDTISKTIRERIKIQGEIKTLTAQGRLSGVIVTVLPFFVGGGIFFMDPEYIKPLIDTKIGLILLCIAFIDEIIGYLIINKIVKINF